MHIQNNVKKTTLGHQIQFPEVTTVDNVHVSTTACSGQDVGSVPMCGPPSFLSPIVHPFERDYKLLDRLIEDPLLTYIYHWFILLFDE